MTRFVVVECVPPRVHNPPNWAGTAGGCLITHIVFDTVKNKEFTSFGSEHAAIEHAMGYNESLVENPHIYD
jgi:hypothetical protein